MTFFHRIVPMAFVRVGSLQHYILKPASDATSIVIYWPTSGMDYLILYAVLRREELTFDFSYSCRATTNVLLVINAANIALVQGAL